MQGWCRILSAKMISEYIEIFDQYRSMIVWWITKATCIIWYRYADPGRRITSETHRHGSIQTKTFCLTRFSLYDAETSLPAGRSWATMLISPCVGTGRNYTQGSHWYEALCYPPRIPPCCVPVIQCCAQIFISWFNESPVSEMICRTSQTKVICLGEHIVQPHTNFDRWLLKNGSRRDVRSPGSTFCRSGRWLLEWTTPPEQWIKI